MTGGGRLSRPETSFSTAAGRNHAIIDLYASIRMADKNATNAGIGFWGFGSALAITISWSLYESVLWATVHGVLSWFYVIYYVATR